MLPAPPPSGIEWSGILRTIRSPGILFGLGILAVVALVGITLTSSLESLHKVILVMAELFILLMIIGVVSVITWARPDRLLLSATEYQRRFEVILGASGINARYDVPEIESRPLELPPKQLPPSDEVSDGREESR